MNLSNSFRKQIKYRYAEKKNRLRTSCASAVGRGYFKKMKIEDGAVQPITAAIWFRFAPPKFLLHCVPQKLHIAAERYMKDHAKRMPAILGWQKYRENDK